MLPTNAVFIPSFKRNHHHVAPRSGASSASARGIPVRECLRERVRGGVRGCTRGCVIRLRQGYTYHYNVPSQSDPSELRCLFPGSSDDCIPRPSPRDFSRGTLGAFAKLVVSQVAPPTRTLVWSVVSRCSTLWEEKQRHACRLARCSD